MKSGNDVAAWIALGAIPGLGGESFRKLLAVFGAPENVFSADKVDLGKVVNHSIVAGILRGYYTHDVDIALKWLDEAGNGIVTLADSFYPRNLLDITDPPTLLYLKGNAGLLGARGIAIVGSRNATPQGIDNSLSFSRSLSNAGLCIVSGLALGIDAAAHRGGLEGASSSIAVIGTGMDIVYPVRNHDLSRELETRGLLVSEFPLGMPPLGSNFPRRNRIISGLGMGCLVVEAGIRSGSLITARHALEQGKDVFAIPGSIHSPLSKGPHRLIKEGAKLVECANDILEELGRFSVKPDSLVLENHVDDADSARLLELMGYDPVDLDTLCLRSGWAAQTVSARLLELEMDGFVSGVVGGMYQRLH